MDSEEIKRPLKLKVLSSQLYSQIIEESATLDHLRQVDLLNEGSLSTWGNQLKVPLFGSVEGDVGEFWRRGWLRADRIHVRITKRYKRGVLHDSEFFEDVRQIGEGWHGTQNKAERIEPEFHRFRIYPCNRLLKSLASNWAASSVLNPNVGETIGKDAEERHKAIEDGALTATADRSNGIADLAVLLEPLYWPWITSRIVGRSFGNDSELARIRQDYIDRTLDFAKGIDLEDARSAHEQLRVDAAWIDDNGDLYRLLRAANWDAREKLVGRVGLALWLRHMAEVIRRGLEEVYGEQLLEEDMAFGMWYEGARARFYGNERALDNPTHYRRELLERMGLDTSVRARWYVEGETELGYLQNDLGIIRDSQVEILNRKGRFSGKASVDLFEEIDRDRQAERFSIISADRDVEENWKTVSRLAEKDLIVGYVSINDPDFEFANFTLEELIGAAIRFDETDEFPENSKDLLQNFDWSGVSSGKAFDEAYQEAHGGRRRGLKSLRWGKVLNDVTADKPNFPDGRERPVRVAIRMAHLAKLVVHKFQRERFRIDPGSFQVVNR